MRSLTIIFLFVLFGAGLLNAQSDTSRRWLQSGLIYNSFGVGYGEGLLCADQFNIGFGPWIVGCNGRFNARHDEGTYYATPYNGYDTWSFVNEYSVLLGHCWWNDNHGMVTLSVGPEYRLVKMREWPTKGSGTSFVPGIYLYDGPGQPTHAYGAKLVLESCHMNRFNRIAIGLSGFVSVVKGHVSFGATLNLVSGKMKSEPYRKKGIKW